MELACDAESSARIVRESGGVRPWECSRGPFAASDFAALTEQSDPWTFLVAGVDRVEDSAERLREAPGLWGFAPRWRIDDVQVSHAPPGGSIGAVPRIVWLELCCDCSAHACSPSSLRPCLPRTDRRFESPRPRQHVDNYDVFLLQGRGSRRWSVEDVPRGKGEEELVAGLDVRILTTFAPTDEWELQPGDALYLPPRFAHHGVSTSAECLTYSIGFRAPSRSELITSFARHAAGKYSDDDRYSDADLLAVGQPLRRGAIEPPTTARVRSMLREAVDAVLNDDAAFEAWLGEAMTASAQGVAPQGGRQGGTQGSRQGADAREIAVSGEAMEVGGSEAVAADAYGGPNELGPSARQAMSEWISGLEAEEEEGGREGGGVSLAEEEAGLEAGLEAELEAELAAGLLGMEAEEVDEEEVEATVVEAPTVVEVVEEEEADAAELGGDAEGSGLVVSLLSASADAPSALRLAEGATIAYVQHAASSSSPATQPAPHPAFSLFVNGARVATLHDVAAASYLPLLCASSRVEASSLVDLLRESAELRQLVETLVRRDLFWAEV